jgi:hypothetical protein
VLEDKLGLSAPEDLSQPDFPKPVDRRPDTDIDKVNDTQEQDECGHQL